jgi:hypothetical protein
MVNVGRAEENLKSASPATEEYQSPGNDSGTVVAAEYADLPVEPGPVLDGLSSIRKESRL